MEIFKGRPMAVVGLLTLAASAAVYFGGIWIALAIAATAALTVLTAFLLFRQGRIDMFRLICAAVLAVALLSVSASSAYFSAVRLKEAESLCGNDKSVTGTVIRRKTSTGYSSLFLVRLRTVEDKRLENGFDAELYCEYPSDLQPGFEFDLTGADILAADEAFGEYAGNYIADGIFLSVTSCSGTDCTVIGEDKVTYALDLTKFNSYLSRLLTDHVGGDEGGLAAAMLLRNTDGITANVRRDFNRAGISHLLAVSGLHMSVMTGILAWILARLGLHRSLSTVFLAGFALAYLAVLGFPFSAIRSVIMLFIVYGVYFAGFDTDGMNSLGIALTLICVVSPAAFLDTGFVLSFCATAGIVSVLPAYSEEVTAIDNRRTKKRVTEERKKRREISKLASVDPVEAEKKKKAFRREKKFRRHIRNSTRVVRDRIAGAVLVTVSAQMLTLLPVSLYSGTISKVLLPANLLLCPLGAIVLFLAALFLPFASVPYISGFLAYYLRGAASLLLSATSLISEIRNVSISLFSPFATGLIVAATLVTAILMTMKLRYRFAVIVPSLCVILILCVTPLSWISGGVDVRYICDPGRKSDALVVCDGDSGVFVTEMSAGSYAFLSNICEHTKKKGHTEIEALMLTHYHIRHEAAVERFMNSQRVRTLLIPRPVTKNDLEVFWKLCDAARKCGTECRMYEPGENLDFCPGIVVECSGPLRIARSTHPVFSVSVCVEDDNYSLPDNYSEYRITIFSASAWDDTSGIAVGSGRDADCLIIGMHGPVCKTVPTFELTDPRYVLISDASVKTILLDPRGSVASVSDPGKILVGCTEAAFEFPKK